MGNTFSKSFQLVKESFQILKSDKEIAAFPILASIFSIVVTILFVGAVFLSGTQIIQSGVRYIIIFFYYLVCYFVVSYFYAGLVSCVHLKLSGNPATFKDGLSNANRHIFQLFLWSLISATVGLVLRIISDRSHIVGRIVSSLMSLAWGLLTFFVIPIIVLENNNALSSIGESGQLFKKTWGENAVGQFSISFFFFWLILLGAVPYLLLIAIHSIWVVIAVIAISIIYWVVLAILISTLNGIFSTALYEYAKTGQVLGAYNPELIQSAFQQKQRPDLILGGKN